MIGERPNHYESRTNSIDIDKIISLSELFMFDSLSLHNINEPFSLEPLKQSFLTELQHLLVKLKWYDVNNYYASLLSSSLSSPSCQAGGVRNSYHYIIIFQNIARYTIRAVQKGKSHFGKFR